MSLTTAAADNPSIDFPLCIHYLRLSTIMLFVTSRIKGTHACRRSYNVGKTAAFCQKHHVSVARKGNLLTWMVFWRISFVQRDGRCTERPALPSCFIPSHSLLFNLTNKDTSVGTGIGYGWTAGILIPTAARDFIYRTASRLAFCRGKEARAWNWLLTSI
jgi:hypothetical protein